MEEDKYDVTKYAKSIFGDDLVESAYILDKYKKHLNTEYTDLVYFNSEEISLTDTVKLVVKLINGKSICIWTSEWGGVQSTV